MGEFVQTGIFEGNLNEFNEFLYKKQLNGARYVDSQYLEKNKIYFALFIDTDRADNLKR